MMSLAHKFFGTVPQDVADQERARYKAMQQASSTHPYDPEVADQYRVMVSAEDRTISSKIGYLLGNIIWWGAILTIVLMIGKCTSGGSSYDGFENYRSDYSSRAR